MSRTAGSDRPAGAGGNDPRIEADAILEWVRIESPSHDADAVNRMVDHVESAMRPLSSRIERTPGRDGFGDVLEVRSESGGDGPGILVPSHLDRHEEHLYGCSSLEPRAKLILRRLESLE